MIWIKIQNLWIKWIPTFFECRYSVFFYLTIWMMRVIFVVDKEFSIIFIFFEHQTFPILISSSKKTFIQNWKISKIWKCRNFNAIIILHYIQVYWNLTYIYRLWGLHRDGLLSLKKICRKSRCFPDLEYP